MKRFFYFAISYKIDLITALTGFALAVGTFYYFPEPKKQLAASALITALALLVMLYERMRERSFVFSALTRPKDKESWIGYGNFDHSRSEKAFSLTQADPGYVHSRCLLWADYKVTFDFKIVDRCLGVIVRAVDLANYVMLQITPTGIRPHIRINGGWKVWEASDVKLDFEHPLSLDRWYRCEIFCENDNIAVRLYHDRQMILNRNWSIPKGSLIFSFKTTEEDLSPVNIPFSISLEYGSIGFRNSGPEKALIRNILILKL